MIPFCDQMTLRWRHNGRNNVSNHQPHECLLNRLFRRRSTKTSKLRVTGLCAGNLPGTSEFSAQMASNVENVCIWWRHHKIIWFHSAACLVVSRTLYQNVKVRWDYSKVVSWRILDVLKELHLLFILTRLTNLIHNVIFIEYEYTVQCPNIPVAGHSKSISVTNLVYWYISICYVALYQYTIYFFLLFRIWFTYLVWIMCATSTNSYHSISHKRTMQQRMTHWSRTK